MEFREMAKKTKSEEFACQHEFFFISRAAAEAGEQGLSMAIGRHGSDVTRGQ